MKTRRYHPTIRRDLILNAAVTTACKPGGWTRLTRQAIATEAGCSEALVSRYLGNMRSVRKFIMKAAIKKDIAEIIIQSVVAHDGYAPKGK